MLRNKKLKKAFTLVEMMIVVIIIGILMGALLPKFQGAQKKARDTARKANLSTISTALLMRFNDEGDYPTWDCMSDITKKIVPNYLSSIPKDPQKSRITSWTNSNWCSGWVYAYSNIKKYGAAQWGSVVVANIEAFGNVANWVLSWTELNWDNEYVSWLNVKICQNWVFQTWSSKVQCSSSNTKWYASKNGDMVYVQFN